MEKELAKAIEQAQALGADPETLPKVKELRHKLENDAVDVGALESEVYDHLFSFFRRYYSEGDFLAKRVYKPGVYAIPYEGEEVTLHWANKDQYYIKTSEYLRDYAFRLRPNDDRKPMRVHFRLADAAEGEHGNVKADEGKDRVFILAASGETGRDFIAEEDGEQGKELGIRFEYRPATLTDWPDDARAGKSKPPSQKDLIALAARRVLAVTDALLVPWIVELGKLDTNGKGTRSHSSPEAPQAIHRTSTPSTTSSTRTWAASCAGSWTSTSRTKSCNWTTWRTRPHRASSSTSPRSRSSARSRARSSTSSPSSRTSRRSCG